MKRLLTALGALVVCVLACSSSDEAAAPPDYTGSCSKLATRCHGVDDALAKDCHELGHAGDTSKCGPRLDACLAVCPEREGGAELPFRDAGGEDASADAGRAPACVTYCECMKDHCSSVVNYPFSEERVCYDACATFSEAERSCFTHFCQDAADAGARDHACDHASSRLGTAECP